MEQRFSCLTLSHPLCWRLRDIIYVTLTASGTTMRRERRHRLGRIGWWCWIAKQAVQTLRHSSSPPSVKTEFAFLLQTTPAHFNTLLPVIEETAARGPVIVWGLALSSTEWEMLSSIPNVKAVAVDPNQNWGGVGAVLSDAFEAWREFRRFLKAAKLSREEREAFKFREQQIIELLYRYLNWRRGWSFNMLGQAARAVFLSFELSTTAKALVDVYRGRGLRCIQFCHGFRNSVFAVTECTDYCTLNDADQKWFMDRVKSTCHIHALGNPRLEVLVQRVGPPRIRADGDKLRLLFLSQYTGWDYTEKVRDEVLAMLKLPEDVRAQCILRMRPHPHEAIESLRTGCSAQDLEVDEWSAGSLEDDIIWCDAVATFNSMALLEAAVCGRLCYWINPIPLVLDTLTEWQGAGVGFVVKSHERWVEAINNAIYRKASSPAMCDVEHLKIMKLLADNSEPWLVKLGLTLKMATGSGVKV